MIDQRWRQGEATTMRTTTLPEAHRRFTIDTTARIIVRPAVCAALRPRTILLSTMVADITLQCYLNRAGIIIGKFAYTIVTLTIIFAQGTRKHSRNFSRDACIRLLRRGRYFFE